MATTKSNSRTSRTTSRRTRDSDGRFASPSWTDSARERPYTTAAIAAGVAGVGAFLWSRRGQISEMASTGMDKLSELKAERMGGSDRDQADIAAEALTLKETGKRAEHPADPVVEQQTKAGAVAY